MITQDIRYGWRLMVRKPAFALVAVLTLGLGIGANVTMFSWTQITLQRQIRGVPDGGRLVALNGTTRSRIDLSVSYPDFLDLRERRPDSVEDLIVFTLAPMSLRTNGGDPQRTFGQLVSGNFFSALGVRPALGRAFLPEEDTTPNGHPVVVISDSFWQRRFGGDPSIVGRTVTLNGIAYTVIGVAPPEFRGTEPYLNLDLWVPMAMQPSVTSGGNRLGVRGNSWLEAMVRLKPGVSIARAQADLDVIARNLADTYADDKGRGLKLSELWRAPSSGGPAVVAVMVIQQAVAGVVLLIACANVAQSAARESREPSTRNRRPADARRQPKPPRAAAAHRKHAARTGRRPVRHRDVVLDQGSRAAFRSARAAADRNESNARSAGRRVRADHDRRQRPRLRAGAGAAGLDVVGRGGAEGIRRPVDGLAAAGAHPSSAGGGAGRAVADAAGLGRTVSPHAAERAVARPGLLDANRPAGLDRLAACRIRRAAWTGVLPRPARPSARAAGCRGRERRDARCRSDSAATATRARASTVTHRRRTRRFRSTTTASAPTT